MSFSHETVGTDVDLSVKVRPGREDVESFMGFRIHDRSASKKEARSHQNDNDGDFAAV
jgi:hypothetical protein